MKVLVRLHLQADAVLTCVPAAIVAAVPMDSGRYGRSQLAAHITAFGALPFSEAAHAGTDTAGAHSRF